MSDDLDLEDNDFDLEDEPNDQQASDGPKGLRKALKLANKTAARVPELEKELASLRRERLVFKAGLTSLSDKQIAALSAVHDGEDTAEALRATAVTLGFAEVEDSDDSTDADVDAQERISDAATGGRPAQSGVLRGTDVAAWGIDRRLAFAKQHPTEWERLKRGEEVTGLTGY